MPWSGSEPPFGFSPAGVEPWLPMPEAWRDITVENQDRDPASTLWLFRRALALRRAEPSLRGGTVTWLDPQDADDRDTQCVLRLARWAAGGRRVVIVANFGSNPTPLPPGEVLLSSVDEPLGAGLPGDAVAIIAAR
jgi:alpha-glucosidase